MLFYSDMNRAKHKIHKLLRYLFLIGTKETLFSFLLSGNRNFYHIGRKRKIYKNLSNTNYFSLVSVCIMGKTNETALVGRLLNEGINSGNRHIYAQVKERIARYSYNRYSTERWKMLSVVFITNGLLTLGYECRKKAKESAYKSRKNNIRAKYNYVVALIEDGYEDEALIELDNIVSPVLKHIIKDDIDTIRLYLEVVTDYKREKTVKEYSSIDTEYKKYICGRDAIVVGPVLGARDAIPFNTEGKLIIRNNEIVPRDMIVKSNISYYVGKAWQCIKSIEFDEIYNRLDYVVISEKTVSNRSDKTHRVLYLNSVLFCGACNMLPKMIFDLVIHGINNIEICGNNLYSKNKRYCKDYVNRLTEHKDEELYDFFSAFAVHDPISQFAILRNMYRLGMFIPDSELKSVIEMEERTYIQLVEDNTYIANNY